ncbi:MAG: pyrroline-5-carboxylate reductase [Candidatus Latescibacterota bacterium]
MIESCRLGFVGAGNMGGALIAGLLAAGRVRPDSLTAVDPSEAALAPLRRLGVGVGTQPEMAVHGQDVVVLAVKPQVAPSVLAQIGPELAAGQLVISLMAGISTARLEAGLGREAPVVRAMPQTLARLGVAASALCAGRHATPEQLALARALLEQVGRTVVVREEQMDAVTGLSGSGPGYIYLVVEAMIDAGVRVGLPRDVARELVAQTVAGAARMVQESGLHPAVLRDQVTSPGGTTIAGLHVLEEKGLRDALMSAVQAAAERAAELGSL